MKPPWASRRGPRPVRPDRALVFAHRGDSDRRAEHTLSAYEAAIDAGADGLECDVRLTRDGHLVCVHDRRIDRTSNGRGVVSDLDLAGLESLDFASWHDKWPASADELLPDTEYGREVSADRPDDPAAGPTGVIGSDEAPGEYWDGVAADRDRHTGTVLRLETLLELAGSSPRPLRLLIETKHPTRYAGLVEKELVRVLRRFGHGGEDGAEQLVTVMSFAYTALRRVHLMAPSLPTVLLQKQWKYNRRSGELPGTTPIAGPGLRLLREDPDYVRRCHERGHPVYVWTVDKAADLDFVLGLGVDGVISNRPVEALGARQDADATTDGRNRPDGRGARPAE